MSQSISYYIEDALTGLLSSIVGINIYPTNRRGGRLFPYVTIKAEINNQMLGNYAGVYDMSVSIDYSDTAAKTTKDDFDTTYFEVFAALYSESLTLSEKLNVISDRTYFYMARIISQTPTIRTPKRAWQRGLILNIYATPTPASATYQSSLDFSNHRNSMYVPLI